MYVYSMKRSFLASAAALLVGAFITTATPAAADTINLLIDFESSNPALDFYKLNADFTLPAGFSNASLNLTDFSVDDRGVLQLNGVNVASTGIFGPGNGSMVLTVGGPNSPFTFQYNSILDTGPFLAITGPFVTGLNTLQLIVNDTNHGIFGNLNPSVGPTSAYMEANVTFNVAVAQTPVPAALPLFATGLAGLGWLARRRRKQAA